MKTSYSRAALLLAMLPLATLAQVPVDDDGNVVGEYENDAWESDERPIGNEGIPLLSPAELDELIGPIALYPDDLLAVVLPASTYPLQVVQAQRFLEDFETNPELEPDPDWDDSVIALLNYPDVLELLNEDLDWTWRLGEAVVAQQEDIVAAVEDFRNRAYAAGNLQTDEYQNVSEEDGIIEITPVSEEVIYVPYYEPAEVVVYQPRRVYYYYPDPCPVYYYPYPSYYSFRSGFNSGFFWGVTTAYTIGWHTDHLRVFHHSYRGHPYYGHRYRDRWWYRRPSISIHNNYYVNSNRGYDRYTVGDNWRSNRNHRLRYTDQRITRSVDYPGRQRNADGRRDDVRRDGSVNRGQSTRDRNTSVDRQRDTNNRGRANAQGNGSVGVNGTSGNRGNATTRRDGTATGGGTTARRDGNANRDRPPTAGNDRNGDSNRWSTRDRREDVVRGDDGQRGRSNSQGDSGQSGANNHRGQANGTVTYGRQEPGTQYRQRPPQTAGSSNDRPRASGGNQGRGQANGTVTYGRQEPAAQYRQRPPQGASSQGNRSRSTAGNSGRQQTPANNRPPPASNSNRQRSDNAGTSSRAPAANNNQRSQSQAPSRDDNRGRRRR